MSDIGSPPTKLIDFLGSRLSCQRYEVSPRLQSLREANQLPGLHVFATARSKDSISDLEAMGMDTLALEVTSQKSIAEAKEEVSRITGGSLDFLVNNALVLPSRVLSHHRFILS